jgi:peptide/nickel transport system substrate-binding protein
MRPPRFAAAIAMAMTLAQPVQAANLKWGFGSSPASLDPYTVNETFTLGLLGNIYEGLVRRGKDFKIGPALAESWETPEPTRWRFHLRRGVTFHGGETFTADDVLFSAERSRSDTSNVGSRIPTGARFVKVDDYTVDVVLTEPNAALINEWDMFSMMSRKWAEAHGAMKPTPAAATSPGFATLNADGTGPFRVESHQPGVRTVLSANSNWWAKREHNLDKVEIVTISNDATRVAALLSGEVDGIEPAPLQDVPRIEANAKTRVLSGAELRVLSLGFDQARDELTDSNVKGKNPFKDVRVRQAFYLGIDTNLIRSRVMRGFARPVQVPVSPEVFTPSEGFTRPVPDVARAKALLTEAGYPDGFEVGLDCTNDRFINDEAVCAAVASQLARIGIKANNASVPKARYFSKVLKSGGFKTSFFLIGWFSTDGAQVLQNLYACRDKPGWGEFNLGGYCNKEVDTLEAQALVEPDLTKRDGLLKQAFEITARDFAYIPVQQQPLLWGVSKDVDVVQRPDDHFYFFWMNKKG